MTNVERLALGLYLSEFDDKATYDDILHLMVQDEPAPIVMWEPFEGHDPSYVVEQIENAHRSLNQLVNEALVVRERDRSKVICKTMEKELEAIARLHRFCVKQARKKKVPLIATDIKLIRHFISNAEPKS
jgi:hypothetical protein